MIVIIIRINGLYQPPIVQDWGLLEWLVRYSSYQSGQRILVLVIDVELEPVDWLKDHGDQKDSSIVICFVGLVWLSLLLQQPV